MPYSPGLSLWMRGGQGDVLRAFGEGEHHLGAAHARVEHARPVVEAGLVGRPVQRVHVERVGEVAVAEIAVLAAELGALREAVGDLGEGGAAALERGLPASRAPTSGSAAEHRVVEPRHLGRRLAAVPDAVLHQRRGPRPCSPGSRRSRDEHLGPARGAAVQRCPPRTRGRRLAGAAEHVQVELVHEGAVARGRAAEARLELGARRRSRGRARTATSRPARRRSRS